ncbi:MAG: hypothetical protein Q9220_005588, partial [cf. Caloplaca sp. 1 TL-2023]
AVDALVREHGGDSTNLQHLRRIIRPEQLPLHLQQRYQHQSPNVLSKAEDCPKNLDAPVSSSPTASPLTETIHPGITDAPPQSLYLLACPSTTLPLPTLSTLLASFLPPSSSSPPPPILTIPVPLYPPTSSSQATLWSRTHWPTIYKKHNPFGPQPSGLAKAESEIRDQVDGFMALASQAGKDAQEQGRGGAVGAVVVLPEAQEGGGKVVVVAGDGRWIGGKFEKGEEGRGNGNPMAHAVMRAIGLVARKRRELAAASSSSAISFASGRSPSGKEDARSGIEGGSNHFHATPLSDLERAFYHQGNSIPPNGYLCLNLDIYVSHEPCVMCSMALLHSRFGRVVFGKRMPRTGGLTAETRKEDSGNKAKGQQGLGYGLFWRQELNWRMLGWQWEAEDEDGGHEGTVKEETHA